MALLAKRIPAPVVEPIVHENTRYTVPNDKGTKAYVVAWDAATGKQLWEKTILRKCICPLVEPDVQWVFIRHMRLDGERLIRVNERDKTYSPDSKTRRIYKVKQQASVLPVPSKAHAADAPIASRVAWLGQGPCATDYRGLGNGSVPLLKE